MTGGWQDLMENLPLQTIATTTTTFTYRERGTGPAMVFLHGISSGSGSWVYQLMHFGTHARCIAWDAPGYGGSSPLQDSAPQPVLYADALLSFLDALDLRYILLVAHSLGALMATAFAARHPDRVNALVLLDPAIGYGAAPPEVAHAKLSSRLDQLAAFGIGGLAKTRANALVSPDAPPEAVELIRWNMRQLSSIGYAQAAHMLSRGNLLEDASGFNKEALIASGTSDTITPPQACQQAATAFPRGSYLPLPGLGHVCYVENPVMVNGHLNDFRKGIPHD